MTRKERPKPKGPSQGYLVSFGDTMTALLAFFIVLNSLAEEQTGANLYSGTGSFIDALQSVGLDGVFPKKATDMPFQLKEISPLYLVPSDNLDDAGKTSTGPDEEDSASRIVDREKDDYQRFLIELNRVAQVKTQLVSEDDVTFDIFNRLQRTAPWLPEESHSALTHVLPLLRRGSYRVEIIVWATTPSPTAWKRAVMQSHDIEQHLVKMARLSDRQRSRLSAFGKPWRFRDLKRPVMSIVVTKIKSGSRTI